MHVRTLFTVLAVAGQLLLAGCSTPKPKFANQAENIHQAAPTLPENIRRVAVLPLAGQAGDQYLADASETLSAVVFEELTRTKKFETIKVSCETLKSMSGTASWTGNEVLPENFLSAFKENQACDAVLFSELTIFHPYAPIAVGWRFKLVDTQTGQIIWAADEIFDTADLSKATQARHMAKEAIAGFYQTPKEDWTDLHSPVRVGRNSVDIMLATMPAR